MPTDFTDQGTDFAALYRDESAPTDVSPTDDLYNKVALAAKPAAPGPAAAPAPAGPVKSVAAPAAAKPAAPSSTVNPGGEEAGLLARLAPLGITNLAALKGKTDVELRKLTGDVVAYEARQTSLGKNFMKNLDGSWDFSKGPDGLPTGLDATGKVLPPAGSTPAPAPAATPSGPAAKAPAAKAPAKALAKAPAAKRSTRVAPKPAAKRAATPRPAAPTVRPRSTAKKPAAKPIARPAANKVMLAARVS